MCSSRLTSMFCSSSSLLWYSRLSFSNSVFSLRFCRASAPFTPAILRRSSRSDSICPCNADCFRRSISSSCSTCNLELSRMMHFARASSDEVGRWSPDKSAIAVRWPSASGPPSNLTWSPTYLSKTTRSSSSRSNPYFLWSSNAASKRRMASSSSLSTAASASLFSKGLTESPAGRSAIPSDAKTPPCLRRHGRDFLLLMYTIAPMSPASAISPNTTPTTTLFLAMPL
mmetsp:Transcript_9933/g.25471  ORF Transcript_9933/g.25471 Transcript_9933/m.25471 type:complete len:228 (+) Transcript_9933:186-869(+)